MREMKQKLKRITALLLSVIMMTSVCDAKDVQAAVGIEYLGKVSYGGSTVGHFSVDGQLAFCIEHEKTSPGTGTSFYDEIYNNADILKVLYYGYGGAEQWSGFESESHGIVATSLTVSHYYSGTTVRSANRSFYDWLQTQPNAPDNNISISKSELRSYVEGNIQRTENVVLKGDSRNTVYFPLPSGVKLHNVTSGNVSSGKVEVRCGEEFYLTAPLSMNTTWKSEELKGTLPLYQPVLSITSSETTQNLVRNRASDPTNTISLTVKWEALGQMELLKIDKITGKPLPGAVYGIYKDKACSNEVDRVTTGKDGTVLSEKVAVGTYYVKELKAPEGYILDDTVHTCKITAGETVTVVAKDKRATGKITIVKKDSKTGKPLEGAKFGLYAAEKLDFSKYGGEIYQPDELVDAFPETDENGKATLEDLILGEYYIKELQSPYGYWKDNTKYPVKLVYQGDDVPVVKVSKSVKNSYATGKLTVVKTDEETGKPLGNAEFGLYAAENIVHPDGQTGILYRTDQMVKKIVTDGTGTAEADNLYLGGYYLKEIKAPEGYGKNDTEYPVSLTYKGQEVKVVTAKQKITDERVWGMVSVIKTDEETGKPLENAEFGLYAAENIVHPDGQTGILYRTDQMVQKIITDGTGTAKAGNLYLGKYYLKEIKAPEGYGKNDTKYPVSLTYKGQEVKVVTAKQKVTDKRVKGTIRINKTDKETGTPQGDASLKGAVYGLYAEENIVHPDGQTGILYRADQMVKKFPATDQSGKSLLDNLYLGKYYIKEISPSPGYLLDDTKYPVELTYQGQDVTVVTKEQTVKEQVIKGNVQLVKHLQEPPKPSNTKKPQKPEEGAEFQIIQKSIGKVIQTITTDSDGFAIAKNLPYGTYTVHQTKGKDGYALVDDFDVVVQADGRTYSYILENYHYSANLKVVKKDADTGKNVAIAGAVFQILDADGKIVEQDIYYPKRGKISKFKTDENGTLMLPEALVYGDYTLVELEAPEGYLIAEPIPFTVSKAGITNDEWGDEVIIVNCSDIPVKGKIRIEKTGKVLTGYEDGEFIYEERGLAGCTFRITAAETIYTPDHATDTSGNRNVLYEKGETITEITTDAEGKAETDRLWLGDYEAEEISAPEGFLIEPEKQKVTLAYKDQETELVFATDTVYNENQQYQIAVEKTDGQTKEPLEGAGFSLYAAQDIVNADGRVIVKKDTLIDTLITDEAGNADTADNLPMNAYAAEKDEPMYYMVETKVPEGYVSDDTRYTIQGNAEEGKKITIHKEAVENSPTRMSFLKVDEAGNPLAGAVLRVREKEPNSLAGMLKGMTEVWVTDGKGHMISNLKAGKTYILEELEAPKGYVTAEPIEFEVKDTEEVHKIVMENHQTKVSILKVDEAGNPFAGAVLKLEELENGKTVEEWTTSEEAKEFTGLAVGKYKLTEVKAPEGYVIAEPIEFEVKDTEEVHKIVMENHQTKVSILKVDEKGNPVKGAVLKLEESKSGKTVEKWTTTEEAKEFTGLAVGKYKLTEIKAPKGYVTAEPIEFEVKDTEEVHKVVMEDKEVMGKLTFEKKDADTGKTLAGAVFEFRDEKGKVLETITTGKDGTGKTKEYPIGTYKKGTFKEALTYYLVEIKAPEGYLLDETPYEVTFNWKNGKKQIVQVAMELTNKKTQEKLPQTGEFPIGKVMTAAGILCAGGAVLIGIYDRKKKVRKNNRK